MGWNPVKDVSKAVSKGWHETRKGLSNFDKFVSHELGGWDNIAIGAGLVAGTILTGGLAGAAVGGTLLGTSATTVGLGAGAALGLATGGMTTKAGIEAGKAERQAAKEQAAYNAEVAKAEATSERNRRANLLNMRKSLTPSTSRSSQGGGTTNTTELNAGGAGIVLG